MEIQFAGKKSRKIENEASGFVYRPSASGHFSRPGSGLPAPFSFSLLTVGAARPAAAPGPRITAKSRNICPHSESPRGLPRDIGLNGYAEFSITISVPAPSLNAGSQVGFLTDDLGLRRARNARPATSP